MMINPRGADGHRKILIIKENMTALASRIDTDEHGPLISLENITVRVGKRFLLKGTFWDIQPGENWAVLGPNGSGKSSLVGAIAGEVPVACGRIVRRLSAEISEAIGYVSFGLHQRIIAREERRDEARMFSGNLDSLETVRDTLLSGLVNHSVEANVLDGVLERLEMRHLVTRNIRFLSTGEMRKVMIARAMLRSPQLLILDEPFDGLDQGARARMKNTIAGLIDGGTQLILVTHRFDEITSSISHVLCLKDGTVFLKGEREKVLTQEQIDRLYGRTPNGLLRIPNGDDEKKAPIGQPRKTILEMKNAGVRYGSIQVLKALNWRMKEGENWAVIGANGAGKSTFLRLITGDNLQAYANEIYIFGHRRGTGESIWDIKKRVGIISSEFQLQYRKRITAYDVVLSGFFDSIGLYHSASKNQHQTATEWIERLGIMRLSERRFDRLSDGEKRLVLLARAMVKSPELLILDEPCQGLDPSNRAVILDVINQIGLEFPTQLLYVTHQSSEIIPCITHILKLEKRAAAEPASVSILARTSEGFLAR